ncbi:unnamed protein product [Caenorhabditis auriculariae]|uniref:Uncharacterized protein n=1 Tax=Caenorhabditis auriculariae TaxID=2777116 RepID=A0A8S1H0J5_9PELO|nr:unnamed protein product [Caenorhabditis auriculariae]
MFWFELAILLFIFYGADAQFLFFPQQQFGGFQRNNGFFAQQQPFFNLFSPPITTTTQTPIEFIPNPDLEQGNFPLPNPRMWPVGPDWNDPKNSWSQETGWGGSGRTSIEKPTVPEKAVLAKTRSKTLTAKNKTTTVNRSKLAARRFTY